MQNNNSVWHFFASVKLALVTLFLITITSIIGTLIPQKESFEWYASQYGPKTAQLFSVLDIPDMYNSWWFISLLFLLGFNLVICSIDRFPAVWRQVKADGLQYTGERIRKMSTRKNWDYTGLSSAAAQNMTDTLNKRGWKTATKSMGNDTLIFSQKGNWTRTGVYMVHGSILLIFLGAIIGNLLGFKGSVSIPETMERDRIALYDTREILDLGFVVRCNSFAIEFYPNGMPKEYTSSLTILENGQELFTQEIEVNSPLKHKGITFYQSSYEAYQDFVVTITNNTTGNQKTFIASFQKQTEWAEEGIRFGIINAKALEQSIVSSKIWFSKENGTPITQWLDDNTTATLNGTDLDYRVSAKQMYATGLQVAKDPGVWWVYIGCGLMLFGLYVAFFMSHRRIWLLVSDSEKGTEIILTGSANKNRPGFERLFDNLASELEQTR
jgi:cytochrome c biogenesis protein